MMVPPSSTTSARSSIAFPPMASKATSSLCPPRRFFVLSLGLLLTSKAADTASAESAVSTSFKCPEKNKTMKISLYWILFLGQTIGNATILYHITPLCRRLVTSGLYENASPKVLVFGALGVTIIQVCYWLDQYWFATLWMGYNALLGHVILFLSRLNFIFASAVFSALYLVRFTELEISLWRFVLLSTVLFSIFCYTLELERLGRGLLERKDRL